MDVYMDKEILVRVWKSSERVRIAKGLRCPNALIITATINFVSRAPLTVCRLPRVSLKSRCPEFTYEKYRQM